MPRLIYTDRELQAWWATLSKLEIDEIFNKAIDRSVELKYSDSYIATMKSIYNNWKKGKPLTGKQISMSRRWI